MNRKSVATLKRFGLILAVLVVLGVHGVATRNATSKTLTPSVSKYTC